MPQHYTDPSQHPNQRFFNNFTNLALQRFNIDLMQKDEQARFQKQSALGGYIENLMGQLDEKQITPRQAMAQVIQKGGELGLDPGTSLGLYGTIEEIANQGSVDPNIPMKIGAFAKGLARGQLYARDVPARIRGEALIESQRLSESPEFQLEGVKRDLRILKSASKDISAEELISVIAEKYPNLSPDQLAEEVARVMSPDKSEEEVRRLGTGLRGRVESIVGRAREEGQLIRSFSERLFSQ
jgi:hypothetical protein